MPEPWEKLSHTTDLPNPELNPLYNPTLGRNLGRWAQVYFTTPPEKRDQAVVELLRELQRDERVARGEDLPIQQTREVSRMEEEFLCPVCNAVNQPSQRFCGICGEKFTKPQAASGNGVDHSKVARSVPQEAVPLYADPQSAPADTEWIRERTLTRFNLEEPKSGSGWGKYAAMGVIVLLAAFAGLEWISRKPVEVQQVVAAPQNIPGLQNHPQPSDTHVDSPAAAPQKQSTDEKSPSLAESKPLPAELRHEEAAPQRRSADNGRVADTKREPDQAADRKPLRTGAADVGGTASGDAMNGNQELALAQHFLGSKGGTRDTSEAAKWLWKAVGKQNTAATVLLSDLYMRGDGVPKNCDQARLLLVAAAKKGDMNAGVKLHALESGGCQ